MLLPQIPDREEENEMLFGVPLDRVGHATFLHQGQCGATASVVQTVLKEKIPIGKYLLRSSRTCELSGCQQKFSQSVVVNICYSFPDDDGCILCRH